MSPSAANARPPLDAAPHAPSASNVAVAASSTATPVCDAGISLPADENNTSPRQSVASTCTGETPSAPSASPAAEETSGSPAVEALMISGISESSCRSIDGSIEKTEDIKIAYPTDPHAAFWRSQLAAGAAVSSTLSSLGGPRSPPGLVSPPAPRTVPLPAAAGLSTPTAAIAAAVTVAKFKGSSDIVVGIVVAGTSPADRIIVPVRIVLDDSAATADAVAAAAESIREATEHSPVDLAQVRAWCGLSASDPVCDVMLCIGKAGNASLEADLASTGAAIALAVDTSTDGGSVTSTHDGRMLNEDQAASVVNEFAFTVGHLLSTLADKDTVASLRSPSGISNSVGNRVAAPTEIDRTNNDFIASTPESSQDHGAAHPLEDRAAPIPTYRRRRRRTKIYAKDSQDDLTTVKVQSIGLEVASALGLDLKLDGSNSFAKAGGDSLAAIRLAAEIQKKGVALTAADLMSGKSIKEIIEAASKRGVASLTWPQVVLSSETLAELAAVGSFEDAYPATPLQAGMVAATMQDARAYVNQVPLRATRTVSLESLRGALRAVVQHHAILRTSFVSTVAGGIVQVVRASADAAECVAVAAPLAQHLAADKARGFSLADASWIRAALVCDPAGSAQHVVVTIHHALYDGWSLPMIMRDLAAALDGHALEPRPAFRTVVDFIAAQDAAATEAFWTQQLVGLEPAQPLSLGHSARTDDEDAPLAQACSTPMAELQRAAQRAGVTVAVVLKAAWAATLRKFTRSHDVVFGEVLANRDIAVAGADRIVGPLLNTVPCRVVLDDTARAADLVASLQAQHGAVLSHSHAALVDVQRWAGVQGDGKLFNTLTDFDILVYPGESSIRFESLWSPHLSRSQAASILAEFDFGVQQLVSALADKATVESLWTLSPAQQALIARFSHGERVPLPFALVHHGFEARAKQHPDWRAVEHGDAHLSYGDLDACGCALAAALASHGVQRGSRVAVVMQRSIEFVVALVGVLKAGATIVPVDSSFPADRIQFMLDDASVCAIVTTASEADRIAQLSVGDRAVVHTATGDDDAFIVYTSGSTGKPKGFMAIGFDACQWETCLVIQADFWPQDDYSDGRKLPKELKDLWSPHVCFVNGGGPSEVSILGISRLVPLGVVGEIYIGGPGVSRGYINLPDMTAQRFVPDPFSPEPGARMFRTGDLGRLLPDGNFEILGRMDDQVKLKGYRIELDEVAAAMMRHPRVSAAAAVVKDKTHLVGFVVPADVDHDELRDVVAAALPAYMVPAVFVGLAVMPTNTNGKTDKKALAAMHVEIAVDELQTDTERALAAVWSQVLGVHVADIGRATSFFALGGDSISAIRLVAKAKQQGLTLSSALIFKAPTLAKMALAATVTETRAAVSSAPVTGSVALTPIQHMFFAHDWINISHFNQSFVVTPRDRLDIAALTAAIAGLAEHHDMLRARFAQGDDGAWSQTLLPPSPQTDAANVLAVVVESDDDALACIREAQESLSITDGPLLAVRLLHMHDGSQRLFFGIHHLVVDLVSWRVLLDDLETLLRGRPLAPKTLSFQAWAARMAAHAATLDAAPWRDLIGDHTTLLATQPPAAGVPVRSFHARAVLDDATTAQLDAANAPFNTNIQELVLAALVLSLSDVAGCASSPAQLCIELEGHGRESFAADLDVSSTVGWFTSVFPVAFSASTASDIGAVVRQVKHKIRSVSLKGLSYGMIKHLAPPTADNAFVKAHGGHAVAFNYLGRFQSLEAADAFFVPDSDVGGYWSVRHDDRMLHAIELNCAHDGPRLVLSATVEDWIVSEPTMQAWLDRWQVWMQRVVAHCVDPVTHGGRTVSDVPLMASQAAVEQAEAELAAVLSLRARDIVDMYPVTPLQAGFLSAMMRDPSEYTVQNTFDVTGNMDVQRLRAAWHAVAMAHPIVRTVFVSTPCGLVQAVAKDDCTEWTELDGVWSADDDALQAATAAFMAADRARGFSMASVSFHRFTVARVADVRMRVFWTQHHSVVDGWSLPLLLADLMRACAGAGIDAKRVQFRDHVEWLQQQDAAASEQFWHESLAHAADAGRLAPPKPRESELSGAKYGELHASIELPHLAAVCKAHGVTVSTVLRLAWALVLRHFTRSEHVVFGSVVSGRDSEIEGIDEIVGVLINTIAVPAHLPLDTSIASALAAMQSFSGDAIAHSHVGIVDAQRAAGIAGNEKLFDTIMVFENYPSAKTDESLDFALDPIRNKEFVDQPVSVVFVQHGTKMQAIMTFETVAIQDWFAQSMADKLVEVLSRLCVAGKDLGAVTIADVDELTFAQQVAIARFSHGERVPLPFALVHHGFEARAKQHPDWRAVEHGDAHLSYGDLDACGCALAAALASHGVQRGSRVAVVMQRSIEFVVALVGVLKVGATIVPVDSSFPADRIQFMLDDASVCAIVTTASEADRIAQLSVGDRAVVVADARALLASGVSFTPAAQHMATGDDDAVVVYTSGSTGKPKGVPIRHQGIVNVAMHCSPLSGFVEGARVPQFMAIGFDVCVWEVWGSLSNGATLVMRTESVFDSLSTVDALVMTPTGLRQLGSPSDWPRLKAVTVTGEVCPKELKDLWSPHVRFVNGGCPSEATIVAVLGALSVDDPVYYGKPIANMSCYIIDSQGRQAPVGVVGEMCLGGIGVSRGYINLPDMTAQRFVPDPFSPEPGARMFRTGDLGRLLPDGNFEILGRMDDQVKLKGYRIELDEVAAAMMRHPRVSAAAAVVKDKTHLVGFVVPADVDHDELRDVVAAALPAYMTDKKALAAMHVEIAVDALQTDTERALAAVWSQVLGVQVADIGRATSFFALGGDSISAIKAAAAMQHAGISITVPQLFKAQTVARVAALADAADAHDGHRSATEWPAAVLSDETLAELASVGDFEDAYPATPLQAGMVAATMQDARAYVNQVPLRATRTVSLESLRGALRAVVQHHAILRTSFVSTVAGGIVQVVRASADAAECVAVAAPLAQHLAADTRGFSLADASWIRAALVCDPAGSAQHVVVTIHHALYDGWSLPMIMRDLVAALDGHALEPRPAFRTVVDFIAAQDAAATEAFWTQQLVGLEPAQPLSLGHSARTDDEDAPLAQACSTPMAELQRAAQSAGVTVAVVLKAAWAATLRKFTRSHDVVFGEVLANRDIAVGGADRIVGPLLNTVPCRVVLDDTARAADLVASLQAQHGAVLSHSHAALVDVQRWAGVQGDGKLFNTLFVFENLPENAPQEAAAKSDNVWVSAQFDHSHLSRSQAASILAEFDFGVQQLVSALADKATVESLWTLSPAQQAMIARFSHGERVPLPFSLVHHGFEARAKQHPDWRAVEHGDAHLSYGDLDACGCALAAALASHGVQRGSRVAVVMQRSIEFVVALVGVLKAGATIVPVDSSFPADRIQFMLDDASVCAIVTTASEAGRVAQLSVGDRAVVVADARALLASGVSFTPAAQHTATGDDDVLIVYTSGTTGKPKGVPVPHKGVVNVVFNQLEKVGCFEQSRMLQFLAIGFDGCQHETWSALSSGATLVLRTGDIESDLRCVTSAMATPTGLSHLNPDDYPMLKHLTIGGEACPRELKDLALVKIFILDRQFQMHQAISSTHSSAVPVGVVGEMCLGGIGVSRGYINLPDLTAQRFVPDPFSPEPGARMFRTGDLGRLLPDGNFEILGRMDDQVKLKGYRIELDEVAAAMMRHPRVSAAAAVVKDKTHLVGFVVPADVDHDELRDVVAAALPAYMVPAVFVGLAVMPTNTNGKTDKKALAAMHVEIAVDALQTDTERALAAVWSQVLGVQVADIGRATSFFALGGDSISAIKAAAAMQRAGISITVPQLFKAQTVARVAALADAADAHDGHRSATEWPAAVLSDETLAELASVGSFEDAYPATPLQAGMVAATMQDARAYVNQVPLRATRTVSLESLRGALRAVVQHHAILRTSFVSTVAGGIVQVVRASADAAECVAVAAPLAQHLAADKARGFSLADASWIRAALVCDPAGSAQHVVVTIHHALYDGWSLPMIMRDLVAALDGHALEPRPAFRTVVDFIAAQDAAATEAFWTQQLVGLEPAQPLSLGHSARTDDEDAPLAQACSTPMAELQRAAQRAGVTVAVVLKAAWAATLRKFTRSHDVVFGEVLANRDIAVAGADRIVGPLLNTVPCRVVLDDAARAADLVASLQAQHGAVLSHSHAALVDVQRWAGVQGDGKLFNTLFVFENLPENAPQEAAAKSGFVAAEAEQRSSQSRQYSVELVLFPNQDNVWVSARFNHSHLSRSQAAPILAEFDFGVQQLVSALADKATVESLWTLSPAQQALIARFSHGERVPLPFSLVHHGFEARAKQHPDWRAVEHGDAHLSYGDLDACGCALAAALASHGVQRGSRVAVVMQRSIEFVVALVGVLKAGATIVPVDSSFPADRIQFMLDDASVCAIVTTASEAGRIAQLSVGDRAVVVADARALLASGVSFTPAAQHTATANDDFAIIYTSGTTGKPKGVLMPHAGVLNVVWTCIDRLKLDCGARVAQFLAIGFDACQREVWSALNSGATLVLREDDAFRTVSNVDILMTTPTGLGHIGGPENYRNLKSIVIGGEPCPESLKDMWAAQVALYNAYGPTEISIIAHFNRLRSEMPITVGQPMPNKRSMVLDAHSRQVPLGVVGEMCLGGIGVSRGYINLPDLTAQRFVPDPFSPEPGARMFRTGDLGRLLPDGNFEILGRMDDQVKLKGYRIELDEVAAAMMRHPRVSAAAAVVKDKTHLVGFVVPADVDHDELRDVVAAALPAYMVPAVFVGLAVMPTNTNGKTDKKALAAMHVEIAVDALQTDTERALAAVWSQVLGVHVADIGRATSFFALGGDSISAIKAAAAMQRAGISITVPQLFKAQTVARVAALADAADAHDGHRSATEWPAAVLSDETLAELATVVSFEDAYPATPLQAGMVAATMQDARAYVNQVPLRATRTVSLESLRGALRAVVQHHAILRTSFVSTVAGGIVQVVRASADAAECVAVAAPLAQHLAADKARGFSLADASWIRAALVCDPAGSAQHVVVTIHHALYDGWSLPMIMRDLAAALDGHALEPRPAFRTVVDFIAAQDAAATEAFWTQQLVGLEPAQPLSLGHSARTDDEDAPLAQACSTPMAELQRAAQRAGVTVAFSRGRTTVFGECGNRDIAVAGAASGPNTYSVELVLFPNHDSVWVSARFNHSHLSRSQAASILSEFDFGVQQLVTALSGKATVELLWTLSPAQQAAIARLSHGERVPLPFSLVHHGFEARAKQHPDWRAVEHGDAHLSYGDLDACGCALAAALASHGVQRGSRVAVVMQRSIEFVVALVGVLKAGATIVPVDSSFPADRIQFMLDDASVCAIVTTASEADRVVQLSVGDRAVVVADARALLASGVSFAPQTQHMATANDDFAIIYTSGTTGKPKGVLMPHAGVLNVVWTCIDRLKLDCGARVAQFLAIGFDACQREVWSTLNSGATLVLREDDAFRTVSNVDILMTTPTGLGHIGDPENYRNLKSIVIGGEPCPESLKDMWAAQVALYNAYGPTEISIIAHFNRLRSEMPITVGQPMPNKRSMVLDAHSRQVPLGVVGEMCLGGIGVSRGYINLPDMTAQRFVPDPFSPEPGARMFRTGDLGRLLPDGNFEILGRMDDQVKLKGYRIELDEVAAAMMRHPRVSAAAAVVKDKTHLVGFVVPADVDHDELRDVVAAALPAYMVPAVFVGLAVMPTNTNGKTDKKALAAMHVEIAVDALQTDTERALAAVWSQVLGVHVADIGRATSFFALGGDSISAIKAAAAMQRAGISITVPQLFKAQTVARVAALADAADAHDGHRSATEWPAAVLSDETLAELASVGSFEDAYPATPLQAGMVAATMQDARAYVNQVPLRATRTVSLESLRGALRAVVQHHAILRTSFVSTVAGGIVQVVRASADAAECVAVAAPLAQHLAADKARGFSLADASWIRAALVCDPAGSAQHVVVTIHHALYDGWSLPMIMRDLVAALDGHALEPRPAFRTVVDFIAAQDAAATEAFWTQQLVGLEPAQPLSLGHSARTDDEDAPLAQACSTPMAELQRAAQRAGVTVAVVLKAAWAATLRKFTRSHDVVFGEVLANRDIAVAGADRIVGPLLNTVPCRVVLDDTARAADLVASLQAQHGAVLSHSHAALVDVQRWAGVQGDGKLFNTLFVFENLPENAPQEAAAQSGFVAAEAERRSSQSRQYSVELVLFPNHDSVWVSAQFDHSHLSRSQAASILAEFDFGVQQLVTALSGKDTIESLWTLSPAQQALIARFSHGERVPLPFTLVHHGFEARAKQHPDWRAVEHGDTHLSYGDLDACGCALAAALASHGVQRGSRVAVVMQRSIEFVVALVGVLKAGATIVPVDSSFPADRIQFMLDDASVCAIVTTASEAGRIAQLSVGDRAVVVADARALLASGVSFTPAAHHMATGDDDAFIVYTSGSTGKPKGVPVPHIGAANVIYHTAQLIGCTENARMAQFMAIGFDACQWETWSALNSGSTLVLRQEDAFKLFREVDAIIMTPTGLGQLGHPSRFPGLKTITVTGESCPSELKDLWSPHVCFVNGGGPSEVSILGHIGALKQSDHVVLGKVLPNYSSHILDHSKRLVPLGVVGEVHTGGPGISRGYINLPDMTAQRFVPDPFSPEPGARMFRTGDLGRLLPDGNFEILGRMDDQVKLKGYRIELDEVAAAMMRHPRVSAAAAVVKDKTHLVGFVVPADVDHDELRDVVAAALPAYMVPAVFVGLAVMPTNTNGKTDKKALAAMHVEIAVDALQTDTERALAAVWSQVLGVQVADIGRATSFFALGGDSISAIKAAAAMQRAGISITVPQLFKAQTVARVAALADAADAHDGHRSATEWPAAVLSDETLAELAAVGDFVDAYPATPLQAGMVAATMQDARAYVNQVPLRATRTVSLESLRGALRAVVQHHAILRTSFVSTVAGGIVQVVRASADAAECVAVAAPLAQHLAADKARGFSLADASWIRAALVCDPAGSAQHVVVTIHHALYDGWSLPMIMRDLVAALDGHALEPRPAFRTVVDFIAAQDAAATEAFWTQQLVGLEPAQPLSLGHSARTDDEDAPLAQACSTPMAELQRAAQRAGVTVAVVLKAAWAATLRKFTRSHDVVFGEVLANRDIAVAGADRIVGPLLNTVPCRVVLDDTARAADLVASLQAQHGAVLSHSHAALVDVQRWAGVQGDGKLFNTLFVFGN
ncbi:hypothetical protein HK105_209353 [Polyrhizophydium stewartii]|uniref:Carrier domain-containing protein n=1 Tax=Polyrhizophydium stewartii TaxID=2732419 RepID=A0ABR4MV91_9FUNG